MITNSTALGFIGLGNMGGPMAANLANWSSNLSVFDRAGTKSRAPSGTTVAESTAALARNAHAIVLSLPDGDAVGKVSETLLSARGETLRYLVDTSTIGVAWAKRLHAECAKAGIEYVDAPVSGGRAGAQAATIAVMCACDAPALEAIRPALAAMAKHIFHVGTDAGQGQAMKVLNNFLSGTAMAATSEAVAFGEAQGLDMKLMLDVLNVSTGRNTASADKFVNRILTQSFDAGFTSTQMHKDLTLYQEAVAQSGGARSVSGAVAELWTRFETDHTGSDISRIYPYVRGN